MLVLNVNIIQLFVLSLMGMLFYYSSLIHCFGTMHSNSSFVLDISINGISKLSAHSYLGNLLLVFALVINGFCPKLIKFCDCQIFILYGFSTHCAFYLYQADDLFCINMLQNNQFNVLLLNSFNLIHPTCLLLSVAGGLCGVYYIFAKSANNRKGLVNTITFLAVSALLLGGGGALCEGTWKGGGAGEASEIQGLLLISLLTGYGHVRFTYTQEQNFKFLFLTALTYYILTQQSFQFTAHNFNASMSPTILSILENFELLCAVLFMVHTLQFIWRFQNYKKFYTLRNCSQNKVFSRLKSYILTSLFGLFLLSYTFNVTFFNFSVSSSNVSLLGFIVICCLALFFGIQSNLFVSVIVIVFGVMMINFTNVGLINILGLILILTCCRVSIIVAFHLSFAYAIVCNYETQFVTSFIAENISHYQILHFYVFNYPEIVNETLTSNISSVTHESFSQSAKKGENFVNFNHALNRLNISAYGVTTLAAQFATFVTTNIAQFAIATAILILTNIYIYSKNCLAFLKT